MVLDGCGWFLDGLGWFGMDWDLLLPLLHLLLPLLPLLQHPTPYLPHPMRPPLGPTAATPPSPSPSPPQPSLPHPAKVNVLQTSAPSPLKGLLKKSLVAFFTIFFGFSGRRLKKIAKNALRAANIDNFNNNFIAAHCGGIFSCTKPSGGAGPGGLSGG